jgi:hypothetical protein
VFSNITSKSNEPLYDPGHAGVAIFVDGTGIGAFDSTWEYATY